MRDNISEAAVWVALSKVRHPPVQLDEFMNNPLAKDPTTADNFIKAISTGQSSQRATSDGKERPSQSFNLPVLASSNRSVIDFIGAGRDELMAAAARMGLIEYHI